MEDKIIEAESVISKLQSALDQRDEDEQSRISPALDALEKARQENLRLSSSLEDALKKNEQLKEDLNKNMVFKFSFCKSLGTLSFECGPRQNFVKFTTNW